MPTAESSLIDRRRGIEEERGDVLDLLLGEYALVAESRHVGARRERFGVVDLAKSIALHVNAIAAQLSVLIEGWSDRTEREFGFRQLVAGVAVGADGAFGIIGKLLAATLLRNPLAVFPVTEKLAVGGIADRGEVRLLDRRGNILRRCVACGKAAGALRLILLQAVEPGLACRPERGFQRGRRPGRGLAFVDGRRAARKNCAHDEQPDSRVWLHRIAVNA